MTRIFTMTLATALMLSTPLMAQSDAGKIKGTVTDETGDMMREKNWSDEQIKTVTGKPTASPEQGTFDEAERTLQRSAVQDDTAKDDTLSAKPDRKTQGEAED